MIVANNKKESCKSIFAGFLITQKAMFQHNGDATTYIDSF
jgi:hypothetical protein